MNVEIWNSLIFGNICFEFSVQCLCSAEHQKRRLGRLKRREKKFPKKTTQKQGVLAASIFFLLSSKDVMSIKMRADKNFLAFVFTHFQVTRFNSQHFAGIIRLTGVEVPPLKQKRRFYIRGVQMYNCLYKLLGATSAFAMYGQPDR